LETRQVCRALYEKPVQFLVSRLDPEIRFVRNYEHIRPEAPDCEESLVRVDFDRFMDLALEEARQSLAEGNKGYGAVVTRGREVLARAHDTAVTDNDPSLHAELKAVRLATARTGDANLSGCVLVSTCEPCPMCAGLAVWANITSIVFGASIADTRALGRSRIDLPVQEIVDRSPATVEVIPGVRQQECLALYGESDG
jgi:tRNA(Arg) A34 adenosine deaminase TadA